MGNGHYGTLPFWKLLFWGRAMAFWEQSFWDDTIKQTNTSSGIINIMLLNNFDHVDSVWCQGFVWNVDVFTMGLLIMEYNYGFHGYKVDQMACINIAYRL